MLAPSRFCFLKFRIARFLPIVYVAFSMGGFLASAPANADTVRISNLSNITVPLWVTGDTSIIQDVFVCVYRANTTGNSTSYGITATGDGPGFLLKSGTNNVAYTVTWNDGGASNPGGGTTATMINNVKLTSRSNARNNKVTPINSSDCNAGASPTARLRITLSQTAMDAARDGVFTGVLTLVLSPT